MKNNLKSIRITQDKNGNRIAYKFHRVMMREVRISVAEADLLISSGSVSEIIYGPNLLDAGVGIMATQIENGINVTYSSYILQ